MTNGAPSASAVANLSARFETAWNAHDMAAFGELFHPDAVFISHFGHLWRGRNEIVARHRKIHETIYRDCRISNEVQVSMGISDDAVLGVVRSLVCVGRFMPTGPREFSTRFSFVAQREGVAWRILAGQNVAVMDPESGELQVEQ